MRRVADLPDDMHARLAGVGLVQARVNATLRGFLDACLGGGNDLKPKSRLVYGHTRRTLTEFFGADKPLPEFTEDGAREWRQYLVGQGLSEAMVCKRTGNAKVLFGVPLHRVKHRRKAPKRWSSRSLEREWECRKVS